MPEPAYLALWRSGILAERCRRAVALLENCELCPRGCAVNRLAGARSVCHTGRDAVVSSYGPHHGEEACLSGWLGSGTIFFGWCNLRCVFCQNFALSWHGEGAPADADTLAGMMLDLQRLGCHNINCVTPTHVVPQILEGLLRAAAQGLRLPLVYNTGAYDSLATLGLLDGVVDIYMPDFKFWDAAMALRYLRAPDYPEVARRAIAEMHRQVGPLVIGEDGIASRGVLLRHLVMPGEVAGTAPIMRWVAAELGPETYVNLMAQYRPCGRVAGNAYLEIARRCTPAELAQAADCARRAGLRRLDHAA